MSTDQYIRFWRKVRIAGFCWEWQGANNGAGYGLLRVNAKNVYAHRFAYEMMWGPIPEGNYVMHRCDNPRCVRPVHLDVGTAADNALDKVAKGRDVNASKTHCRHGHEFTPENTYTVPGRAGRHCRKCMNRRTIECWRRNRRGQKRVLTPEQKAGKREWQRAYRAKQRGVQ